ncbi:ATP-binding protein [Catenulispora subtropica]|uniref:histidine kinase n=1 Tax=Catenulispora subtropica TaxID=450798 RepID=A0ABN2T4V1_9ACTN
MSATTEATPPPPDVARPSGFNGPGGPGGPAAPADPYLRGTDETVLLDLRELRAQQAADAAAAGRGTSGALAVPGSAHAPGTDLEAYQGSHRREAMLYAHGGTAIPLERVREVCHDLRQPVAAILMLASAAEMRPDVPERVREVLQEIMTQTEDISATVRQFLDDAKQGVDGLGDPVPCNVAGLAAESVERWRATFSGRISLAAADEPLHVTVDPVLFKRALGNVLSNGTRAAGGSGRVQVTVRRFETGQGERAVIEVDDSGPGFGNIPAGHGLGLAVVRRTVEAAGGSVEVAEGPLGGALIRMVLPVTPVRTLSADDELAKTIHGEVSLAALAEELAAGGLRPAVVVDFDEFDHFDHFDEFDAFDDDFDDFDDFDDDPDGVDDDPAAVTGGHAVATRISAIPGATAISGPPEQAQLTSGAVAGPFGSAEQATPSGSTAHGALFSAGSTPQLASGAPQPAAVEPAPEPAPGLFDVFRAPDRTRGEVPAPNAAASAQPLEAPAEAGAPHTPHSFHITATGQDDTAVAAILLPSQAGLTDPPRIPASALRPVASVQLSLLPGGAF